MLTGSATGPVTLLGTSNVIGSLGPFSAAGQTVRVATGGNMSLAGAVSAGTLDLRVAGTLTQTAGAPITATLLTGSATAATLGAGNNIASLGPFTAGTGFQLTNAATTVSGNVTVGTGTLSLTSGTLSAGGGLLRAPRVELQVDRVTTTGAIIDGATGLVAVAPRTAGTAITVVDTLPGAASGLALTNAQLQSLAPSGVTTLQVGRTSAGPDASGILLDGTLTLGRPGQTLALYAAGDVAQTGTSKLTVGTVAGSAGGSFLLQGGATAGAPYNTVNVIDSLAGVSAAGGIAVASGTDLAVTAPVSLSGGTGTIALTSRGLLTLNSVIGSGSEALVLQGGGGIQQASPINVASLQGGAGGILPGTVVAKLDNPINTIGALGNFTALQGDVTVFAQAVTVVPGAAVSGRNVSLRSVAGDLVVNGSVGAVVVNGGAVDAGGGHGDACGDGRHHCRRHGQWRAGGQYLAGPWGRHGRGHRRAERRAVCRAGCGGRPERRRPVARQRRHGVGRHDRGVRRGGANRRDGDGTLQLVDVVVCVQRRDLGIGQLREPGGRRHWLGRLDPQRRRHHDQRRRGAVRVAGRRRGRGATFP